MKLRPFELTLVIIFASMAMVALVMISGYKPTSKAGNGENIVLIGKVQIWGTLPPDGIRYVLTELGRKNEDFTKISYVYISPEEFDYKLLRALADGRGPDVILVSQEKLVEMRRRIQPFSYETEGYAVRDIRDKYIDSGHIFAMSDGFYGLPIAVDPLMMYWNKDILATEGHLTPPATWEELVGPMFTDLIVRDFDRTVYRSVVAMGEYENIRNAFGIISALLLQGGSALVSEKDPQGYLVQIQRAVSGGSNPLQATTDFYSRFSRPSNALYSWNRSFQEDRKQFVAEDLALYFGYGSEGPELEQVNPNLSFDIAEVPQGAEASVRRTYAKTFALSILKSSDNMGGAAAVVKSLGSQNIADRIAVETHMVPAYRATVAKGSDGTYTRLTYQSASIGFGWLNPERSRVDNIFQTMVADINENRSSLGEATGDAAERLSGAYSN